MHIREVVCERGSLGFMRNKLKTSGLLLVAVGSLAANNAVSADKGVNSEVSNNFGLVDYLSFDEQKKIYKDLTHQDLTEITKSGVSEKFSDLYKKNPDKLNEYLENNYSSNLLIYNWMNKPETSGDFQNILDKINEKEKIRQEKLSKDGNDSLVPKYATSKDLINSPMLTIDYAFENESPLVKDSDRSLIFGKIKENADKLSLDKETISNCGGSVSVLDSALKGSSQQSDVRNIVANTISGKEETPFSLSSTWKYYAKEGVTRVAAVGVLGYVFYKVLEPAKDLAKKVYNKLFGKKEEEKKGEIRRDNPLSPYQDENLDIKKLFGK